MKNDNKTCYKDVHIWVCKEESGFLGEIITFRNLTPTEIEDLFYKDNITCAQMINNMISENNQITMNMSVETREISVIGKEDCGIVDITEMISEEIKN